MADDISGGCIGSIVGGIVVLILIYLIGAPQYGVYASRMAGEAELSQAKYTRQVAVAEAQAKNESATLLADAEVKRALGVAKANRIIGESLNKNEAYLRYLWIQDVAANPQRETVYIPTEGQLPIMESGRLSKQGQKVLGEK